MKKLIIKNIDKTIYKLIDDRNIEYELNLEFIGLDKKLNINDSIEISMELLNSRSSSYSSFYTFGNLDDITGRKDISLNDNDIIKLIINNQEIYMKRLYG